MSNRTQATVLSPTPALPEVRPTASAAKQTAVVLPEHAFEGIAWRPALCVIPPLVLGLQRSVGNRAVTELLRAGAAEPRLRAEALPAGPRCPSPRLAPLQRTPRAVAVQRDDPDEAGAKVSGREQFEIDFVLAEPGAGIKINFKLTVSRAGPRLVETQPKDTPLGGEATGGLLETRAAIEKASGKWGAKVNAALARADWKRGIIPGFKPLKFRVTAKGGEGKFNITQREADLDLLKVGIHFDLDATEVLALAGINHLRDKITVKATIEATKGVGVRDLARLKSAIKYKDEAVEAVKEAEEHAEQFARRRKELDDLKRGQKGLVRNVAKREAQLARVTKQLEQAEKAGRRARSRTRILKGQKKAAEAALEAAKTKLKRNRQSARVAGYYLGKASKGLVESGKRLAAAGRRIDVALKGVTDKMAAPIKKALEKVTKRIATKLAKTLLVRGLAYMIPGLNVLMSLWDIGSLLSTAFGDSKGGGPGGGGDGDGGSGGGDEKGEGGGGEGATGEATKGGEGTKAGEPGKTGEGKGPATGGGDGGTATEGGPSPGQEPGGAPTTLQLNRAAKQVLDSFAGDKITLDDAAIQALNDAVPENIDPQQLTMLIDGMKDRLPADTADPYELAVEIEAELAALTEGEEATITFEGGKPEPAPDPADAVPEPPKKLNPATSTAIREELTWDPKQQKVVLGMRMKELQKKGEDIIATHPDGLQVKVAKFDVESSMPEGAIGHIVKVHLELKVIKLPAGVDGTYPWKIDQVENESMTFLYDPGAPKGKEWGERESGDVEKVRGALVQKGDSWALSGTAPVVRLEHSTIRILEVLGSRPTQDGKSYQISLMVEPISVSGTKAGFVSLDRWVDFVVGTKVRIIISAPREKAKGTP